MSARRDVVFGATVSGRPAGLPGVESMVGLFINTLPVRVQPTPGDTAAELLTRLQKQQAGLFDHHYLGLTEINKAAGVRDLFDTLVVFESYPIDRAALAAANPIDGMVVIGVRTIDASHYPMTLIARVDSQLRLTVAYLPNLFAPQPSTRSPGGSPVSCRQSRTTLTSPWTASTSSNQASVGWWWARGMTLRSPCRR